VQTFLPFPDLRVSCQVLDDRRLGKQRVETFQILRALTWPEYAWKNHPAVRMWRGFVPALVEYGLENCHEWVRRGYADTVAEQLVAWTGGDRPAGSALPPWWGLEQLHLSHRSALLRKDPDHYRPLFAALGHGDEPDDLPYLWPPDVFPRWPVRGGPEGLPLPAAARQLGIEEPHPWQARAVAALVAGHDVLLVARPGRGGATAGLLAGLVRPGRTLRVSPWDGPVAGPAPAVEPAPARAVAPASGAAVGRPPPLARPAGPADRAAMAAEQAPAEFVFAHPDQLDGAALEGVTLLVVDRADELVADADGGAAVRAARERVRAPVLAVVGRADDRQRAGVSAGLGLSDPVHLGGGWDVPDTFLEVAAAASAPARRQVLDELVRSGRPALVVTSSRERAGRLVTGLTAAGLRAASWAPPPMRAARAAAAVAAWRGRTIDALVVPVDQLPPLGRVRPGLLVGDGAAVDGPEGWHALVDAVAPPRAVLLRGPDATSGAAALADTPGCRRAALLLPFGEPVETPCGRCDVCAPAAPGR